MRADVRYRYVFAQTQDEDRYKLYYGKQCESVGTTGDEIFYDLPITYTKGTIYNPATDKHDNVCLRSYEDEFLAPTIVMKPGQTVRIGLRNQLPVEPDCAEGKGTNVPHCFNTTNLHSHGLWVSPTGNSDNVLPEDHPTGTFWYQHRFQFQQRL